MSDNNDMIDAVAAAQNDIETPVETKTTSTPASAPVSTPVDATSADKAAAKEAKKAEAAAKKEAKKAEAAAKKAEKKESKNVQKAAERQAKIDSCPKEYKPISTSGYFWRAFISWIPVIGFIYTIIMMLIPRNKNLKNFERSIFIFYILGLIVAVIAFLFLVIVNGTSVDGIFKAFRYFIEELASA